MEKHPVFLESGQKKAFAGSIQWPGWCRWGKSEEQALAALVDAGERYAAVLAGTGLDFIPPADLADLEVVETRQGTMTTDFGAPGEIPEADQSPLDQAAHDRFCTVIDACWQAFAGALERSDGLELRKGPRGGGRDQEKMARHVIDSHQSYLRILGWKHSVDDDLDLEAQLLDIQQATIEALGAALNGNSPEVGPRGGKRWPPRYFVRRAAWHLLDHAWEIEDRIV